jgi:NADH dehydrogenase FAD-containing subunit
VRGRVVIVGANFAGLAAARSLGRGLEVTVIDQGAWFEWLPNIHELVSGAKRPETLRVDRRRLVEKLGHRFVRTVVAGVDPAAGFVETDRGKRVPFDVCVVAVGGVHTTGGVEGAAEHAAAFKTVRDCAVIGRRLCTLARRREPFRVVIVGGGLEGVEALGEVLRRYREHPGLRIDIVESGPRLMPEAPAAIDAHIRRRLMALPVHMRTEVRVRSVESRAVHLSDGDELRSDLTIWTGGAAPNPLLARAGLSPDAGSWAPVSPTLQSREADNVLIAGDAASLEPQLSKQAYFALQMGGHAAGNIRHLLAGEPLEAFEPAPKPMLISFGDLDAFFVTGDTVVAAPALAGAKEAVFQLTMAQLDAPVSKASVEALLGRAEQTLRGLITPVIRSPSALQRLTDFRWLR